MSNDPVILPYPKFQEFDNAHRALMSKMCYFIKHYGSDGIVCQIILRPSDPQVAVKFGDWSATTIDFEGNNHPLRDFAEKFFQNHIGTLIKVMTLIRLPMALFYIQIAPTGEPVLVDVRVSLNKFLGPGMLRDIFGKIIQIQETLKIDILNEQVLASIKEAKGVWNNDLIIKPAAFMAARTPPYEPAYLEIIR